MNTKDYALVVGINTYRHLPPDLHLQGACRDAEEFRAWLISDTGGRLPPENVFPRLDMDPPFFADLTNLQRLIDALLEPSQDGEKKIGRRLYFFLSGHGVAKNEDEARFVCADYGPTRPANFAALAYASLFTTARLFDEILVFLDCCRTPDKDLEPPYVHRRLTKDYPGVADVLRCYGLATRAFRKAREHDWKTGVFRGVFTRALLEGLKGAAASDGEYIQTEHLKKFLNWRVPDLHPSHKQNPYFSPDDPINLVPAPPPEPTFVTVHLTEPERGLEIFRWDDMRNPLLPPLSPKEGSAEVVVPISYPRWYKFAWATPRSGRRVVDVLIDRGTTDVTF